jgi:hypothetical protein
MHTTGKKLYADGQNLSRRLFIRAVGLGPGLGRGQNSAIGVAFFGDLTQRQSPIYTIKENAFVEKYLCGLQLSYEKSYCNHEAMIKIDIGNYFERAKHANECLNKFNDPLYVPNISKLHDSNVHTTKFSSSNCNYSLCPVVLVLLGVSSRPRHTLIGCTMAVFFSSFTNQIAEY